MPEQNSMRSTNGQVIDTTQATPTVALDWTSARALDIAYSVIVLLFAGVFDSADIPHSTGLRTAFAEAMVQAAISDGYLDPGWLDRTHPRIRSDDRLSIFGSHRGINPTAREPTWGFQFEIVPMEAWN